MDSDTRLMASFSATSYLLSILVATVLFLIVRYKWKRRALERLGRTLPGEPTVPFFGNALHFLGRGEDFLDYINVWFYKYPSPFRTWLGPHLLVNIYRPDDIEIVLKSKSALDKGPFYKFLLELGEGLFTAPEEKWKRSRKLIAPALNTRLIESFFPVFNEKNRYLVKILEKEVGKGPIDMLDYLLPMSMEVICKTAMGVDYNAQGNPKHEFLKGLDRGSQAYLMRMHNVWLHPDFMWNFFGPQKELNFLRQQFFDLPLLLISQRRADFLRKKQGNDLNGGKEEKKFRNCFLDILLEMSEDGANFTDANLRDEVITMIIGGMETSAIANAYCCLLLAMHPDIQETVYQEVMEVVGDRDLTPEDTSKLVYLEMVLKETLRLFPIGPILLRTNKEEIQLTTCKLPPGCTIVYSIFRLHRLEDIYPEPNKFIPERFTPENIAARHPFAWIPFSGGPRGCIGYKYAMNSMKVTLSNIIRNYKLSTTLKMEDIKLKIEVVLKSIKGYPVTITKREKSS